MPFPEDGRCDDFSLKHPRMLLSQRAKVFSPFAALKGFEEAIGEKVRVYAEKRALNDEEQDFNRFMIPYPSMANSIITAR